MNGVEVIRALLVNASGVTALVPAVKIQADILPQGTALPAILIEGVSSVPTNTLPGGATKHFRDRVQVTPHAVKYQDLGPIVRAAIAACADTFPSVAGLTRVAVTLAGEGPDGFEPVTGARAKSIDFMVNYNRAV